MVNTARRWSGLVDLHGPSGTRISAVRAHISQPRTASDETAEWHGSLLARDGDTVEMLGQLVGLCTMTLGNDQSCQIIVRTDGSFVGVDACPIKMW